MAAADGMPELTNEVRAMRQEIADLKQQLQTAQQATSAGPVTSANPLPATRARKVLRDPFFSAALGCIPAGTSAKRVNRRIHQQKSLQTVAEFVGFGIILKEARKRVH